MSVGLSLIFVIGLVFSTGRVRTWVAGRFGLA